MKGLRISKAGANVLTAKAEDLYVDTSTPLYKVAVQQAATVTLDDNVPFTKRVTINHNLNYEPLYAVYSERVPGNGLMRLAEGSGLSVGGDRIFVRSAVSSTQLIIEFQSIGAGPWAGGYNYFYYIFYNQTHG